VPSTIIVVILAFVDVVGGSGDEGAKVHPLAFFGLAKIARVESAYIATPPQV
jgi:hypothetical protein